MLDILYIFSSVLFFVAIILSALNMHFFLSRKKEREKKVALETAITNEKILLVKKEIRILERRIALQDEQITQLASSLVSFEKVLTTLLSSYTNGFGGGGFGPGDGNVH